MIALYVPRANLQATPDFSTADYMEKLALEREHR